MEYTGLDNLDNTYPSPSNYKSVKGADTLLSTGNAQVDLFGIYPDKNQLTFKIPDFSKIKYVPSTNFRFILAIFKDYKDTKPVYYTSESYYKDLQSSYLESNPYFIKASLAKSNIVSYVYEDAIKMVDSMKALEQKSRIDFRINIFAGVSGSVDYDNLVTYIDWLVDKQSPLDDINFGVLQPTAIAGWNALDGNFATGEVKTTVSASYGIGSQFVSVLDSAAADLESTLKFEQEKLEKIKKQIAALELELKTKANYKLPGVKLNGAPTDAYTIVDGVTYTARPDVDIFRKARGNNSDVAEREKRVSAKLIEEINRLNGLKTTSEKSVGEAQNLLNAAKKAAGDLVNKAKEEIDKLKNLGADLLNKIPKIPKLPDIPKIPNLPSLDDLGGAALALLPQLPALPKLPSLPKKPNFKLPPLKLFKPKKPKEPKKVKKNKGKGLKGAMGDLQDAANSAQKAVGDAQSAAQGAVASVQNAADQATSAVANAQSAVANAQAAVQSGLDSAQAAAQSVQAGIQSAVDSGKAAVQSTVDSITKV